MFKEIITSAYLTFCKLFEVAAFQDEFRKKAYNINTEDCTLFTISNPKLNRVCGNGVIICRWIYPTLLNRESKLDFSPEYKTVGLKSSSFCNSKTRPINETAKDKKIVSTHPVKHGAIYNQYFKPAE